MTMKACTILIHRNRRGEETIREVTRTLPELIEYFGYTLLVGHSYEHEKGNKKINMSPRTAASLVTNLNNAESNSARNGYSSTWYELVK